MRRSPSVTRHSWPIEGSSGRRTAGLSALASTPARMLFGESKAGSSRQACVKSAFRIPYHHAQLFQVIAPQLWCPGWSGAAVAMDALFSALEYGVASRGGGGRGHYHRRRGRRW